MASRLPSEIRELNQTRGEVRWGVVAMVEAGFERQDIIDYIDQNMPRNSEHQNNNWGLRTELDYVLSNGDRTFRWYVEAGGGRSDLLEETVDGNRSQKTNIDVTATLNNKIMQLHKYLFDDVIAYRTVGANWENEGWNRFQEVSVAELMRRYYSYADVDETLPARESYDNWIEIEFTPFIDELLGRLNIRSHNSSFTLPFPDDFDDHFDSDEEFIFGVEVIGVSVAETLESYSLGFPEYFMQIDLFCRSVITNTRTSITSTPRFVRGNWARLGTIDTNQDCFSFRNNLSEEIDTVEEQVGRISSEIIGELCQQLGEQTNLVMIGVALGWNEQFYDRNVGDVDEYFETEIYVNPNLPRWYSSDFDDYHELFD